MSDYWTPTHHAVEHEDAETLARLLANGADPDEVFSNMTLLTAAIDTEGYGALQGGQPLTVHTVAVLLAFGADPQLADSDGRTPLDVAISYDHDLAVVRRSGSRLLVRLRAVVLIHAPDPPTCIGTLTTPAAQDSRTHGAD